MERTPLGRATARHLLASIVIGVAPLQSPALAASPLLHSHNDYRRPRPLLDAFAHGFDSVEVDLSLVGGELLAGHDAEEAAESGRTLEELYLRPLKRLAEKGALRREGRTLTLLVEFKTGAKAGYRALLEALEPYSSLFTEFDADGVASLGPVTLVVSESSLVRTEALRERRVAQFDGSDRLLDAPFGPDVLPWINVDWREIVASEGIWPLPKRDRMALRSLAEEADARGRRLRVWGHPDEPRAWDALLEAGVGILGTDDPAALKRFLKRRGSARRIAA